MNYGNKIPNIIVLTAIIISSLILFFIMPDWAVASSAILLLFWTLFTVVRYFTFQKTGGDLLYRIPTKKNLLRVLVNSISLIGLGIMQFFHQLDVVSTLKLYSLGFLLICSGVLSVIGYFQFTEIRQKGILYESGSFYRWIDIENFVWAYSDNKLSLNLKGPYLRKSVDLVISALYRKEFVAYLTQYTNCDLENIPLTNSANH